MQMKKYFTVFFASIILLSACQMGDNNTNEEGRSNTEQTRSGTYNDGNVTQKVQNRNGSNRASNRANDRYEVSEEAARKIVDEIPEIDQAYVITTQNNAYVAAMLDDNNGNTTRSNNNRNDTVSSPNRIGAEDDRMTNRNNNGRQGEMTNRNNDNIRGQNDFTNRNNRINEGDELTDEVKNKITEIVKEVDSSIDNVYVSTSPDFFNLTNNYVEDFNNGRPVEGFFDQIGNMIERVFPQNRK